MCMSKENVVKLSSKSNPIFNKMLVFENKKTTKCINISIEANMFYETKTIHLFESCWQTLNKDKDKEVRE